MATSTHRLIQDQNSNILYNETAQGGKTSIAKTNKKGGLGGRKALNDISNSRKPSLPLLTKRDTPSNVISIEKDFHVASAAATTASNAVGGKTRTSKANEKVKEGGGRKALSDLTNSVKASQPASIASLKVNAAREETVPSSMMQEGFLHNHQECIKAQKKEVDLQYFLKSAGLYCGVPEIPAKLSSKKTQNPFCHMEMEEMAEQQGHHPFDHIPRPSSELSPYMCRSPKSPNPPYMNWEEDESNLSLKLY